MPKKIKIISTLGPNSLNAQFLAQCRECDQLYFRLNGSHLPDSDIRSYLEYVRQNFPDSNPEFYLDLQGSKVRIGDFPAPVSLSQMQQLSFVLENSTSDMKIPLPYSDFFLAAEEGDILNLQDGQIKLRILKKFQNRVLTRVEQEGNLKPRSGISIQNKEMEFNGLDDIQKKQIEIAKKLEIDYLALSYVKRLSDLEQLKAICNDLDYSPKLIAKIEHPDALKQLLDISKTANEIWFCRGDLGAAIPQKELGYWQDMTIQIAHLHQTPLFIAGQVFHHLTYHNEPTRSEVVHFYHILKQDINGIVLSDETTIGINPINAHSKIISLF